MNRTSMRFNRSTKRCIQPSKYSLSTIIAALILYFDLRNDPAIPV